MVGDGRCDRGGFHDDLVGRFLRWQCGRVGRGVDIARAVVLGGGGGVIDETAAASVATTTGGGSRNGGGDLMSALVYWCQGRRGCSVPAVLVDRWAGATIRWHQVIKPIRSNHQVT